MTSVAVQNAVLGLSVRDQVAMYEEPLQWIEWVQNVKIGGPRIAVILLGDIPRVQCPAVGGEGPNNENIRCFSSPHSDPILHFSSGTLALVPALP